MFGWLVGFLTSSSRTKAISRTDPKTERLTILRAATHETELGDHDFCLSRSQRIGVEGAMPVCSWMDRTKQLSRKE